eukprot:GILK01004603.1.p1 GENE.GILK01004603.1~~GILK01004603.1.p1  ORF type:complete len:440 (+),score=91.14 GILK01004603.1:70-1389(+)
MRAEAKFLKLVSLLQKQGVIDERAKNQLKHLLMIGGIHVEMVLSVLDRTNDLQILKTALLDLLENALADAAVDASENDEQWEDANMSDVENRARRPVDREPLRAQKIDLQWFRDFKKQFQLFNASKLHEAWNELNGSSTAAGLTRQDFRLFLERLLNEEQQDALPLLQRNNSRDEAWDVLDLIFDVCDRDRNGIVDRKEFMSGLSLFSSGDKGEKLRSMFLYFDENNDGFISKSEFRQMYHALSDVLRRLVPQYGEEYSEEQETEEVNVLFELVDENKDGKLSYDEFQNWQSTLLDNKGDNNLRPMTFLQVLDSIHDGDDRDPGSSIHAGHYCDSCGQNPIIGTRYRCRDCENFELCAECKASFVFGGGFGSKWSLHHTPKHVWETMEDGSPTKLFRTLSSDSGSQVRSLPTLSHQTSIDEDVEMFVERTEDRRMLNGF